MDYSRVLFLSLQAWHNPYYTAIETGNRIQHAAVSPDLSIRIYVFLPAHHLRLLSETSQNIVLRKTPTPPNCWPRQRWRKRYSLLQDNIEEKRTRKGPAFDRHHLLAYGGYAERRDYEGDASRYVKSF